MIGNMPPIIRAKYRDRFRGARDRLAPGGIGEAQDRGDQRACVRDADPENEIDDVEAPEDRPLQAGDAHPVAQLEAPGDRAPERHCQQRADRDQIACACTGQRAGTDPRGFSRIGKQFGRSRHAYFGPLQIKNFGLGAEFLEQTRRAPAFGQRETLLSGSFRSPNTIASAGQDCTHAG